MNTTMFDGYLINFRPGYAKLGARCFGKGWLSVSGCLLLCLLCQVHAHCAITVILARHAEKAQSLTADAPLSSGGQNRANLLALTLADAGVKAIYVTQYLSAQQTAEPLASRLHLSPERIDSGDSPKLVDKIRENKDGVVLVIGHSATVPQTISLLGGPVVKINETEFNNIFILTISGADVAMLRLRYGEGQGAVGASDILTRSDKSNNRRRVMYITFWRSGGFTGAATNVQGKVNFGDTAIVTSGNSEYRREVSAQEAQQLRSAVEVLCTSKVQSQPSSRSSLVRDGYQYRVTLGTDDGEKQELKLTDAGSPELEYLLRWVQQESQTIWMHRVKNR